MDRLLTHSAGQKQGERVRVAGWIAGRRDHGKLIFIDLRDASGVLQLVFRPDSAGLYERADKLRPEWVIAAEGTIRERPQGMENPKLSTGMVELAVDTLEVLAEAKTPPFPLDTDGYDIDEELRLKYRYLDLRRERLQRNLKLRSRFIQAGREYLFRNGFTEIETPLLTKSTPEGARDFLVPSRIQPGTFYALPQSPQQYKQLLMIAGFERYFQIARAVRDEDLRADRGFEHTQIDMEMSFAEQPDVMAMAEGMIIHACAAVGAKIQEQVFPVLSHREAVARFGDDKFDLRNDTERAAGVLAFAWVKDFPLFERDGQGRLTYAHNPFTAPHPEDRMQLLRGEDLESLRSLQYDLVCNGLEVGGGGIRSHERPVLEKILEVLGHSREAMEQRFGHFLEALDYGAPPHGGIALGVERLAMVLTGEGALREVQAFPMTSGGKTAVMDAPSEVDPKQLAELGLEVKKRH